MLETKVKSFTENDFTKLVSDFIYQMLNEMAVYNLNDCSYYVY